MSDSKAELVEEECSLCFGRLRPFWDLGRLRMLVCCGKSVCSDCMNKQREFLDRAVAEGTYGRQERQLASTCPLCRTPTPTSDDVGRMMLARFKKGELPIHMYWLLGVQFIEGDGGLEVNVGRGVEIMMLGAERGAPNCQYMIGRRYDGGRDGLPNSTTEAKRWLLAATEQGHAVAEHNLAELMKEEGNDAEFLRHLRGSASKGYDVACCNLGVIYYEGLHGVQQRALTPAAERGHASSMGQLGLVMCCPEPGLMTADNPSFTRGVHWLRRDAEKGNEDAISNLKAMEEGASSMCFGCDKEATPGKAFLRCSRCRAAWYCSKDCQKRHWRAKECGHKQFCIEWK